MRKTAFVLAALASFAMVSEAAAWSRDRTVTNRNGTSNFSASGTCASGACTRNAQRTGPRGNSLSATSAVTCDADQQNCTRSKTYQGSNGGSATVEGSISR